MKSGIRIRLFFWANRALADWQLKSWLSGYPVDQSIFAPAQPVYVARPIFIGMPDPVPIRSGIWRGDRDVITPPAVEKAKASAPRATAKAAGGPGSGYGSIGPGSATTKTAKASSLRSREQPRHGSRGRVPWPIPDGFAPI